MDYIRELLAQKEKNINTDLDKQKIENLKFILKDNNAFFNLDFKTAVGILAYLGVPENEIKALYLKLISPENYLASEKPFIDIHNL